MLEELAKADKLEQMNQQRRRMKLQTHKRKVEELWSMKKQKIMEEKNRREEERREDRRRREEEEAMIERQKQLLVEKHLPFIKGFCSKDLMGMGKVEQQKQSKRHQGNDIFGVSMERIEKWEREKENRRRN